MVGSLARYLGAGRMNEENEIDNTAGIVLEKKIGEEVSCRRSCCICSCK